SHLFYNVLFTSAVVTKCCTVTQPKTPKRKQCRCRSTVARKNSLEGRNLGRNLERNQARGVASPLLAVQGGDFFQRFVCSNDGKLSFDEFNAYFADGILTTEELQELFYSIDGRQNNNLDTDKLSDYFAQHLGEYLNVLSALETLNVAILKAMDKTKEVSLCVNYFETSYPSMLKGYCQIYE
uniref:N-terminal EF-hand calcium binding protein 3 n=1 Tax=Hucho hucho TaxID=62062 RepID=A0A4W5REL2_9TELE